MGVSSKNRRKIVVDDVAYVWYVGDEDYEPAGGHKLVVISQDKQFIVHYPIMPADAESYVIVLGKRFANATSGGVWRRFISPRFDEDGIVTPAHVRQLVLWCLDDTLERRRA